MVVTQWFINTFFFCFFFDTIQLVDMPTHQGTRIPLDGVGTTFTLVKATVHREGAVFPPFVYQHELDSEGFAKMVKSMGFSVYGIPSYTIYHF